MSKDGVENYGKPASAEEQRDGEDDAAATKEGNAQTVRDAKKASDSEQRMTLLQGIKLYPKAVAWSILISTCIVMEGYDISLINNFYAFPQFSKKYGEQMADGNYEVPARVIYLNAFLLWVQS